ncbi:MAG: hypothetical protein NWR68_00100, partial [Litorivicinaceae bacterium]|nr:hypothetical protein [Litorivicinaceae bacterium]
KSVALKIGAVSDVQIDILWGLNEGDLIVTSAQFLIDSESSKTSDFSRFETPSSDAMAVGNTHQDPDMPMTNANQARGMPASEAHQDHAMPMTDAHQGHDIPMTDAHQGHDMPVSAPIDDMHQSHEMNMPASVDDPHDGHSQSAMTMRNSVSPETMQ